MICAAGVGSRLGLGIPKCLVTFGGQTLLARQVGILAACGIEQVRVVVGFREELVIAEIDKLPPPLRQLVVVVRNREYDKTSTLSSLLLGIRGLKGRFVSLDADVLFWEDGLRTIVEAGVDAPVLGVVPAGTTDAVFVQLELASPHSSARVVVGFTREEGKYEWVGVAVLDTDMFRLLDPPTKAFVYEALADGLSFHPLQYRVIEAFEVDTEADLHRARVALREHR